MSPEGIPNMDVLVLALGAAFFAASFAYIGLCDRL